MQEQLDNLVANPYSENYSIQTFVDKPEKILIPPDMKLKRILKLMERHPYRLEGNDIDATPILVVAN